MGKELDGINIHQSLLHLRVIRLKCVPKRRWYFYMQQTMHFYPPPPPRPLELKLNVTQRTLRTYKGRQHVVFIEWSQKNLFQGEPGQWQHVRRSNMNFFILCIWSLSIKSNMLSFLLRSLDIHRGKHNSQPAQSSCDFCEYMSIRHG
jgi:hypothetical protein